MQIGIEEEGHATDPIFGEGEHEDAGSVCGLLLGPGDVATERRLRVGARGHEMEAADASIRGGTVPFRSWRVSYW